MSLKKTIQINPELFKISGSKTRKSREKKELSISPLITPNSLKNKLLKRIKEHKTQEINGTKSSHSQSMSTNKGNDINPDYSDEFYGAINYLSDLSKNKKTNEAKQRLYNLKTLKNTEQTYKPSVPIFTDLPEELKEPIVNPFSSMNMSNIANNAINMSNNMISLSDDVPYGCLKGGKKRTYREWKELTREPDATIRPPTPPKKTDDPDALLNYDREQRLNQIKTKLRKIQDEETLEKQRKLEKFKELEDSFTPSLGELDKLDNSTSGLDIDEIIEKRKEDEKAEIEKNKKYLKKTVKRKFTLGKSDKLRRVSVLIKDKQTRKNVIDTQKELKKTNLTDVKKYLRQHGMIKVGSTCPADILRKTFESAMLTGDVTNTNKDTLLHNFLATQKE